MDYYTNYIKSRPEWQFINIYTDEGVSATDTRHRDGNKEEIQYDIFSGFLVGLSETGELSVDFNEKLFHWLVIM